ncbi:MAG: hypothetical protein U9Q66_01025 [Patescibacteria group bacterium]|nr:hypothetical protein [Patescibacteria group bacterium]
MNIEFEFKNKNKYMNNENNDNIIEDFIFNNILKSDNINNKILNLYDKINDEKI